MLRLTVIYVDADTSDENDRGFGVSVALRYARGVEELRRRVLCRVEGNHPGKRGRCHVVPTCIIRTSSVAVTSQTEQTLERWRLQRVLVVRRRVGAARQNDD